MASTVPQQGIIMHNIMEMAIMYWRNREMQTRITEQSYLLLNIVEDEDEEDEHLERW